MIDSELFHDLMNLITISKEMAKSAQRQLNAETGDRTIALAKIEKSIHAMERIEALVKSKK